MQAFDVIENFAKENGADATIAAVVPWFIFWQSLYWVCIIVSPMLFETYNKLEGPMKSYWASSMVCSCIS